MTAPARMRCAIGTMALLAALCSVGPATAADTDSTSKASAEVPALAKKINEQKTIRVRGEWGRAVLAHPTFADGIVRFDSLLKHEAGDGDAGRVPELISWSQINQLETRGNASGTGALVGACVGFAGGVAAGIGLSHMCLVGCPDPTSGEVFRAAFWGGAAGALVGTALGAIVGVTIPKWHTAYQRPSV